MSKHTKRQVNNFKQCTCLYVCHCCLFYYSLSCVTLMVWLEVLLSDWIGCCCCWTWIVPVILFAPRGVSPFLLRLVCRKEIFYISGDLRQGNTSLLSTINAWILHTSLSSSLECLCSVENVLGRRFLGSSPSHSTTSCYWLLWLRCAFNSMLLCDYFSGSYQWGYEQSYRCVAICVFLVLLLFRFCVVHLKSSLSLSCDFSFFITWCIMSFVQMRLQTVSF